MKRYLTIAISEQHYRALILIAERNLRTVEWAAAGILEVEVATMAEFREVAPPAQVGGK
jgi:hypothetical protein